MSPAIGRGARHPHPRPLPPAGEALAVGWHAGQLKVGSFARSERMAKWNEVLRIEEALGADVAFAGAAALPIRRPVKINGKPGV